MVIEGDKAVRIKSSYIAGSRYAFAIEFDFDRPYIAKFKVRVMIKQSLGSRYFSGINISTPLEIEVNPAYLAGAEKTDLLS